VDQAYGSVTNEVIEALKEIVGEKNIIQKDQEKLAEYGHDIMALLLGIETAAEVVVKPESTEQVSKIMKLANEKVIPVTPRGAGTGLAAAVSATYGGIVLSLEKMNRILEINKVDRVAIVEPGVITNELCRKVEEEGLMYVGYPMSTESSFIGGNVATNAGGAKVIRYGNTQRHILGLEVVLPDGQVIELGGSYRKSTWGYNLLQLMVGSEGTLGIFTKITINLISNPGKTIDLIVPFADNETAVNAVSKVIVEGGILPETVEFMDRTCLTESAKYHEVNIPFQDNEEVEAYLIIQVFGASQEELETSYEKIGEICIENGALDVFIAESRKDSENIWKVREEFGVALREIDPYTYFTSDVVVPFSKVPEMMKELKKLEKKYKTGIPTVAHIADGNLHSAIFKPADVSVEEWPEKAESIFDEMIEISTRLGGVGSGEHGVGYAKKEIFTKLKPQAELDLMRGIKKVFDPNNILNPGKVI